MENKESNVKIISVNNSVELSIPFIENPISAGFPSPAQDFLETGIDLNKELISHPVSTFFGKVKGDSMKNAGIDDGDLIVIDKSLTPKEGDVAVCFIDGDFTLKFIKKDTNCIWLVPANPNYKSIKVTEENNFVIWGIVTFSIKKH